MKIFEITTATDEHDTLKLKNRDTVEHIFESFGEGISLKEGWPTIELYLLKKRKKCDLVNWYPEVLVMNTHAVEVLGDLMQGSVEYLPVIFDGTRYKDLQIVNILNILDAVDYEKSECFYDDEETKRVGYVKRYAFYPEKVKDHHIFKVITGNRLSTRIFVSQTFLDHLNNSDLKGYMWREVWDSETGPAEIH